jgi:hypothetical protein
MFFVPWNPEVKLTALKSVSGYFTFFTTVYIITMPNMFPLVTFHCASTLHIYASIRLHFMGAAN